MIKTGRANHFIDEIGMKGQLTLNNTQLLFETDIHNFRQYTLALPLKDITDICLKNNLRIFPYGIVITLKNGTSHRFAVWGRKKWIAAIQKAANSREKNNINS